MITFSEENGTKSCFIGDYRKAGYSEYTAFITFL